MKKFMKKTAKGFTLVELIIVIGLMSILAVMVGLIMKPISQVFADTTAYTEDRYVMDGLAQYIDENLKYADRIFVLYDYSGGGFCTDDGRGSAYKDPACSGCNSFAGQMSQAWGGEFSQRGGAGNRPPALDKLQCIAIINDPEFADSGRCGVDPDHFKNNDEVVSTCRVYKSEIIDGQRRSWLVGGEAFYGDGAYFFNLENTAGVDHMQQGAISYTLYSFDMNQYEDLSSIDEIQGLMSRMRDKTPDEIMDSSDSVYIQNRVERTINFKNTLNWGKLYDDAELDDERGIVSPVDGDLGSKRRADGSSGEPGENGESNSHFVHESPGYNIYIFYTVPE